MKKIYPISIISIVSGAFVALCLSQIALGKAHVPEGKGQICIQTRIIRQFTIRQTIHRLVSRIDIIDDGPGIPAEIEKNVFYPLITGRPGGTGLGLSIAQSLINMHGGLINYERKNDKTIFSIYLPMSEN